MFIFSILAIFLIIYLHGISFILFSLILLLMCIPGYFVRLPQINVTSINTNVDNRSLSAVLKESFAHKGFRLLVIGFLFVVSNYFNCYTCTKICTRQRISRLDWNGYFSINRIFQYNWHTYYGVFRDKYSKKILSGLYFLRGITLILFIFLPPQIYQQYCLVLLLDYYG